MQIRQIVLVLIGLITLSICVQAFSADDAIALVTKTNNYLMPNENAIAVKTMINYQNQKYFVVAAQNGDSITCYIPVTSSGVIATKDIEIRETIKTAIIFTKMTQIKNNTTPANWLFSYTAKNQFYGLQNDFLEYSGRLATVKTELDKLGNDAGNLVTLANQTQATIDELAIKSKELAEQIDTGMNYENKYLTNPDANMNYTYENKHKNLFNDLDEYRKKYASLTTSINQLTQGIGALQTNKITIDTKRSLQAALTTPISARGLDSYFGIVDQMRTLIESIFSEARTSDKYASVLLTRKARNESWIIMYGQNDTLQRINPSFSTLEKATNAILSTENIDLWNEQDAVSALKTNWNAAVTRFNNLEYDKAKEFATKAQNNVKSIMSGGVKQPDDSINQDLIIKIIVGLTIILIILFAYEKFFVKKKETQEEDYNEP